MNITIKTLVGVVLSITLFFIFKAIITYTTLSSFTTLSIDAIFDHDDVITAYYSSGIKNVGFREKQRKHSDPFQADLRSENSILLNNHIARRLRIDIGREAGSVNLYEFRFVSRFGPDIVFSPQLIYELFTPNPAVESFELKDDHVAITITGSDPYLTLIPDLMIHNPYLQYLMPLLLTLLCVIFYPQLSLKDLHAIKDINSKQSSAGVNYDALDGVRGLAALMILGIHTGVFDQGGIFGVWLFFGLSGFLLASPFLNHPDRALSYRYMSSYLFRRCKRIVPMYFVMITCFSLLGGHFIVAFRHYLFLQADGHYWTIPQEMFFYLLLPAAMILNTLLARIKPVLSILFFLLLIIGSNKYLNQDLIRLYGNGASMQPFAGIFFSGILFAVIYRQVMDTPELAAFFNRVGPRTLMAWSGSVLIITIMVTASPPVNPRVSFDGSTHPEWFGFAGALFIFLTIMSRNSFLEKAMRFLPLRAMGIVGFSFYLLHPQVISCIRGVSMYFTNYYPTGISLFVLSGVTTYLVSLFTYSFIERPFIALAKKEKQP